MWALMILEVVGAGLEHVEETVGIIFAYIGLVSKQDGVTTDR